MTVAIQTWQIDTFMEQFKSYRFEIEKVSCFDLHASQNKLFDHNSRIYGFLKERQINAIVLIVKPSGWLTVYVSLKIH